MYKYLLLSLILFVGTGVQAGWFEPTGVAPENNVDLPIQWTKGAGDDMYRLTGKVGIGTGAPNALLHIKSVTGANAEIDIQSGSKAHWGIYQDETTEQLRLWNGDNRLVVTKDGNVGIGTANPGAKLEVVGDFIRTIPRWAGYSNDPKDDGILIGRTITFTKKVANTGIRVMWSDNFRALGTNVACTWEILFNGVSCSNPGALRFDKFAGDTYSNRHDPTTVFGTCFGLPVGTVMITTRVGTTPGYVSTDCYTGWTGGALTTIEAEEVR